MEEIRLLSKEDIDVRVAQTNTYNNNGQVIVKVSLLLYKNARVDMKILDELFTPMGWKRTHKLIGDRLYCQVEVYDQSKKEWICKEDVGVESNTEAEKGQASDSFKRACVNWGIGRELYTAPKVSVTLNEREYTRGQDGRIKVWASFSVKSIGYDVASRTITSLEIQDKDGNVRYAMGIKAAPAEQPSAAVQARRAAAMKPTPKKKDIENGVMTPEQFRERWNSDEEGGGITYEDIAVCARSWGLFPKPKIEPIEKVKMAVLKAAGVQDEQPYTPMADKDYWKIVKAYAEGKKTKTGGDYRQTWIEMTHAKPEHIAEFDNSVDDYKAANGINL